MSGIDVDILLEPVSSTDPTGEDLAYTPEFQQLLDAASGRPERVMGDNVIPAVEPDWKSVLGLGVGLLSRSKDIRTAIVLCRALLHTEGFLGLDSGIALTRGLLAEYWDSVHPQLDPDDNKDPTERVNALLNLCDRDAFLMPIRAAPLVSSRTFGEVSLREIEIAKGESSEPADAGKASLDLSTINAAFQDCKIEQLRQTAGAVSSACANIKEIETLVTDRVGFSLAPDLGPIAALLSDAEDLLSARVAERADAASAESVASAGSGARTHTTASDGEPASPAQRVASEITSREDVVRILDRLCDYYASNEPSSPVPLLLQRARRLVTKDFVGIVQDLAPEALAQIEAIRGSKGDI